MTTMTFEQFAHELEVARKNKTKDPNPQPFRDKVGVVGFIGGVAIAIAGVMSSIVEITTASVETTLVGGALMIAMMLLTRH